MSGNGAGLKTTLTTLDPSIKRLIDEHLAVMRRVLEARLLQALDAHMVKVNEKIDAFMVRVEDLMLDEDDPGDDDDEPEDHEFETRRRH